MASGDSRVYCGISGSATQVEWKKKWRYLEDRSWLSFDVTGFLDPEMTIFGQKDGIGVV